MRLSRSELTKKVNDLEKRIDIIHLNKQLSEYFLKANLFWCKIIIENYDDVVVYASGEILDVYERFNWYKKWIEDWTIIVELNEEETEKVQENKKKSKSK